LKLTSSFGTTAVDGGSSHQDIVHNRERTFTADPMAILVLDTGITHDRSFVQANAMALDCPSKGDLIWVEILPA
jgi:hypothetical protein